ncbi:HesB/YadR/YfhF family protein [Gorillibacterium massiliense]|uniref:HesB/YadR/YfhF family protein n=1 Tax=Gorillibacterium massiliense TaxID=1280390 RepID=UPI0004AD02F8|nr:Fe-S cluster assembly protein HesB [Gorillibacterium massiliense]
MKISVTDGAMNSFQKEWGVKEGDHMRVFVRYNGGGSDPFCLGVTRDHPQDPRLLTEKQGISFFMEQWDLWSLDGKDLEIDGDGEDISFRMTP